MSLKLSPQELQVITQLKSVYELAANYTNVRWQIIAGIHFRESGLAVHVKNPFQFDPAPGPHYMSYLFGKYSNLPPEDVVVRVNKYGVDDFETAAILCGCFLHLKTSLPLSKEAPSTAFLDACYGYNGRGYGSAYDSPYCVNGLDDSHMNMHLVGTLPDGNGGRKRVNIIDHRPGAFTVFQQLIDLGI